MELCVAPQQEDAQEGDSGSGNSSSPKGPKAFPCAESFFFCMEHRRKEHV